VTKIIVRYTKLDLLRLGLYATLRRATLRRATLVVAVVMFAITLYQQWGHWNAFTSITTVVTAAIVASGYYVAMIPLMVLATLLRNGKGSPAAEIQTYSFSDLGLTRQAASSDTLLKWGGARSLHRSKHAIYIGISASSYFILPRHCVASDAEYESLWKGVQRLAPDLGGSGV
jgi:hypothetical protein